jgi:hypothetical protein
MACLLVLQELREQSTKAPVAARVLSVGEFVEVVIAASEDEALRGWAVQALGNMPTDRVAGHLHRLSPEVRSAVSTLARQNFDDWTHKDLTAAELRFLGSQSFRVPPAEYARANG